MRRRRERRTRARMGRGAPPRGRERSRAAVGDGGEPRRGAPPGDRRDRRRASRPAVHSRSGGAPAHPRPRGSRAAPRGGGSRRRRMRCRSPSRRDRSWCLPPPLAPRRSPDRGPPIAKSRTRRAEAPVGRQRDPAVLGFGRGGREVRLSKACGRRGHGAICSGIGESDREACVRRNHFGSGSRLDGLPPCRFESRRPAFAERLSTRFYALPRAEGEGEAALLAGAREPGREGSEGGRKRARRRTTRRRTAEIRCELAWIPLHVTPIPLDLAPASLALARPCRSASPGRFPEIRCESEDIRYCVSK